MTTVFYFSWDNCNTQKKLETMEMQNFFGEGGGGGGVGEYTVVNAFRFSHQFAEQIDDGFFNKPIMVSMQILVERWVHLTRISVLFLKWT